jgi:diaminopropionate ammonia-lyase
MIRVDGNYDDSVRQAAEVSEQKGWTVVSDTSWLGYERIPGLVMQGYTAIVREALRQLPQPPTHVFVQAGVGGIAAAVAGHLAIVLGDARPTFIVVEPARAACVVAAAQAGRVVKVAHDQPTVMAMLECYEASPVAWRVLARVADAFMTVDEGEAVAVMRGLARPVPGDPAIVSGESGGVGLGGQIPAVGVKSVALGLDGKSRVLLINTEGATDPHCYAELVGQSPADVLAGKAEALS